MSEAVKEIFLEGAEKYGWLNDRFEHERKIMARKMLLDGESVERVARWTELSVEMVESLI